MEEQVKVLRIQVEGTQTVAGLRKEISDLRDTLINCEEGTEEYRKVVDQLCEDQKTLTQVMQAGKNGADNVAGSYNALQAEMTALRKVWKEVGDEASRNEIGARIADINTQLKDMDASIGNSQRKVGSYEEALKVLSKEYASQKQEMRELKIAMEDLDPASEAYQQAFARCAEITHNLTDQQEKLRYASPDLGDQLSNIRGIAGNMAAGFSAAQAAMGLFGKESEDVQKAMLKIQQGMALVQGLEGLDGFIKRTEGLSTAMGKWLKGSKEVTVQTVAQGTAMKTEATATNAQTVATEGATVAQKGLNAAMKANPIGLILGALALLVANWEAVKNALVSVVGGQEKANKLMNSAKTVIAGVGSVITNTLLMPLKLLINNLKTIADVAQNLFKGNFKAAAQSAKQGIEDQINIIKNGINIVDNYQKGASDKAVKIQEEETKKKKEQYDKDKENYIKDEEAKHGSDWKYTEEGKKAYEELYKNRSELYKKDTEEYRQNQRDMWSYANDYQDRITKKIKEESKKRNDIEVERLKKIKQGYESVLNAVKTPEENTKDKIQGLIDSYNAYVKEANADELVIPVNLDTKSLESNLEEVRLRLLKYAQSEIAKPYVDNTLAEIARIEKVSEVAAASVQSIFDIKDLTEGAEIPQDVIDTITKIYSIRSKALEDESDFVEQQMTILESMGLKGTEMYTKLQDKLLEIATSRTNLRIDLLKTESSTYLKGYEKQNEAIEAEADRHNRVMAYKELENARSTQLGKKDTKWDNFKELFKDATTYKGIDIDAINSEFDYEREILNKQVEMWKKASEDMNLTDEDRNKAYSNYVQKQGELYQKEMEQVEMNNNYQREQFKLKLEAYQEMASGISDIMGSVVDMMSDSAQTKLDAGIIDEEEYKKIMDKTKGFQIAQATINTISGAIGAFMQTSASYPAPYGQIAGGIAAAAITASGIAEIQKIKNTNYGKSSGLSSSISSKSITLPKLDGYIPNYVTNTTGKSDVDALKNAIDNQQIYVSVTDINKAQNANKTKVVESTF